MKNILKLDSLESLILKFWPNFVDKTKIMAFVLEKMRDSDFNTITEPTVVPKSIQIKMSRFEILNNNFITWFDFVVPKSEISVTKATIEIIFSHDGEIENYQVIGHIFTN